MTITRTEHGVRVDTFVDGRHHEAGGDRLQRNVSPADLTDLVSSTADSTGDQVQLAVVAAGRALAGWRALGSVGRAAIVLRAAQLVAEHADELASLITREHGKLLREAGAEVQRTVELLQFIGGGGRRLAGANLPADEAGTLAITRREAIGVVGLITPWNFPLAIPAWKLAAALVAGCTAVLKPSPLTPATASALVECFVRAGIPAGVLNLVLGGGEVGAALVADPGVAGVSFTGSVEVGRAIHQAGAPRFLRTQLEMGGKNAALVLADADLELAADAIMHGAFGQAGQRCSATSRVVVAEQVHDRLVDALVARIDSLRVGPGFDPAADLGPVISEQRLRACLDGVSRGVADGARMVRGGRRVTAGLPDGYYLAPTLLDGVQAGDQVAQEELFGPVLSVISCRDFADGIATVNSVRYGMAAAVFTRGLSQALQAMDAIEVGMLHVNRPGVGAYPHLPHIGTKQSQYGPPECSENVWDFYTEWRSACISY